MNSRDKVELLGFDFFSGDKLHTQNKNPTILPTTRLRFCISRLGRSGDANGTYFRLLPKGVGDKAVSAKVKKLGICSLNTKNFTRFWLLRSGHKVICRHSLNTANKQATAKLPL